MDCRPLGRPLRSAADRVETIGYDQTLALRRPANLIVRDASVRRLTTRPATAPPPLLLCGSVDSTLLDPA